MHPRRGQTPPEAPEAGGGRKVAAGEDEAMQDAEADPVVDSPCPDVLANPGSALAKLLGAGGEAAECIRAELADYQQQVQRHLAKAAAAAEAKRRKVPGQ